jgi:hypothetical protein
MPAPATITAPPAPVDTALREQILAEAEAELHADLEQTYGRETAALIRSKIAYARWAKGRRA